MENKDYFDRLHNSNTQLVWVINDMENLKERNFWEKFTS